MPPETLILFAAVAVGGLLFAVVAVAVVVLLVRGMARSARSNPALQGTGEQYLTGMAPRLQPWHAEALADFSSLMEYVPYLKDPVPPLLQKLAPGLQPEEEDWLLALVGLEVYDCIARDISDRT